MARTWDDAAMVISPAARISDWAIGPVSTLKLAPPQPAAVLDADGPLLPFADRLSQVLHYAAMPVRLEPLSATKEHRCIASGGNAHGVQLWVRLAGPGFSRLYRLDITEKCLIQAAFGAAGCDDVHTVELIPVARMGAMIKTYGEFGLCLLLLEAGMLQAQLLTLAAHLGLSAQTCAATQTARFHSEGGHDHWSCIVLPGISIAANAPCALPAGDDIAQLAAWQQPRSDDWPLLQQMMRAIQAALDVPMAASGAAAAPMARRLAQPFAATVARSSGEAAVVPDGQLDQRDIQALVDTGVSHARALDPGGSLADLSLQLVLWDDGGALQIWAQAPGAPWRQTSAPPHAAAAAGMGGDVAAVLTVHASDAFARTGDAGCFARAFLGAGALVQGLCLAGPGHGAFVRPHKAIPDAIANAPLPIGQRALVQVHIGALAALPLRYPLL
jgi:hypothetical protein